MKAKGYNKFSIMCFTASMKDLIMESCGNTYTLTGYRYYDAVNMVYWYESSVGVWLLGDSMRYKDGRIK